MNKFGAFMFDELVSHTVFKSMCTYQLESFYSLFNSC